MAFSGFTEMFARFAKVLCFNVPSPFFSLSQFFVVSLHPNIKIYKDLMKTFEELGVSPEIRRAIEEMGYACPMPVQEEVIPYLLGENNDVVALAQTGTGKTAAFGLPLIQQINVNNRIPQSLILFPTL